MDARVRIQTQVFQVPKLVFVLCYSPFHIVGAQQMEIDKGLHFYHDVTLKRPNLKQARGFKLKFQTGL